MLFALVIVELLHRILVLGRAGFLPEVVDKYLLEEPSVASSDLR
jgi:hypothetical protein